MSPVRPRTSRNLMTVAATAALFAGIAGSVEARDTRLNAAPLDGQKEIFGFSQVLRRNTGPDVRQSTPDSLPETVAPVEDEIDADGRSRPGGLTGRTDESTAPAPGEAPAGDVPDVESDWRRAPDEEGIETTNVPAPGAGMPGPQIRPGGFILNDRVLLTGETEDLPPPDLQRSADGRIAPPGVGVTPLEPEPYVDPLAVPLPPPRAAGPDDFIPVPDRWRLADTLNLVKDNPYDPYDHNTLKGDKPIWEGSCFPFLEPLLGESETDCFIILLGISDTVFEPRSFPTPTGVQTTSRSGTNDIFGKPDQFLFNQNFIHGFSLVNGDTAFRPQDIEFRYTGVLNANYADVEERRILRADPTTGTDRFDSHYGIQELFVDYHIANITDRYDFYSIRAGIQPFSSDFRGFLFQDNQLGVRFFGNWDNNLWQYNLAWFRRLEKDTNSGLNEAFKTPREDDVFIANVYRQDFPILGVTSQATAIYNRNREGDDRYFDDNGFLARPASFGSQRGRDYDVVYLGYNVDGRIGRVNLTGSGYYAFGNDDNVFTDESSTISAFFAAAELSMDFDWARWRLSGLYASGDSDPYDNKQGGFDAIFENPQFAGGDTSYWIRQQIPLIGGGGTGLSSRNAVLPSLRPSKEHGQSQFVNPGILLVGAGADFDLAPSFRISGNANYMWFDDTSSLETLRNQGSIDNDIGLDLSAAAIWRPYQTQNFVVRLSGAVLLPGEGFNDLYAAQGERDYYYSVLANIILTY
ncbi:hypothetical protein G5B40_04635 [Pikeienuella piscinae]|uniref:Alginate export domain-containing protein n=1 Tax=Pikeienuella piscinae TaxID=2748098 RepID=A0A7L5BU97_9RHOB|nr:hypothetical protein [Pikeienuella piscinae]QIE54791.1 hypothetical protein G5B40_04635 [Pikeienuella piscinae]